MNDCTVDNIPEALAPMHFFKPLGFAKNANEAVLNNHLKAKVTHGRVAMLVVIGFLVIEAVKGRSFLFDVQISRPAITHYTQVPDGWDVLIMTMIRAAETQCAQIGWVDPVNAPPLVSRGF